MPYSRAVQLGAITSAVVRVHNPKRTPATNNDEASAEPAAANPFVCPDFTQECPGLVHPTQVMGRPTQRGWVSCYGPWEGLTNGAPALLCDIAT